MIFGQKIAIASGAYTASQDSADLSNKRYRGAHIIIDVTAATLTPSVVFTVQGKDLASGKYYDILDSAAITGVGTTVLTIFPAATGAANLTENNILPETFRIHAEHADADSITYSVGVNMLN